MDPYIGKMLDNRYEILEKIGTGGMAVVYKAKCHRLNRLVAIKILKSDLAQDEDFRRRFNAESQAVAQLSHANIVSVYDVSKGGDIEYIVMELIDGITLKQYMEKRGQLNWREALHFITQVMRGLSHAHSRGIVHRDIKPQNIMVLRDGSVKVADFGIACLENSAQTLTQEALGSVHYISPEQARGDRIDARSDIYSAGVVLYEMLTNRLPFEGDSAVSVAIQHLSSIPLAPREINASIPQQLELICMKAMAPDLNKRYISADAMIADLEAFRKNPGVDLDFNIADLRPDEEDEPTRLLRTSHMTSQNPQYGFDQESNYERNFNNKRDTPETKDPVAKKHPKKRIGIIIGCCAAAAVVLFLLFRVIFGSFGMKNQEYTVPKVVGYTVEEANDLKSVKGVFQVVEDKEEASSYDAGTIISQDPQDGETRKSESGSLIEIHVTVSSGETTCDMIDVTNMDVRNAKLKIKELMEQYNINLTIDDSDDYKEYSDDVASGDVISSDPAAGASLSDGDTIVLVVSKGPESKPITIPDFRNMDVTKATKQAQETYHLVVKTEEKTDDTDAGTVIDQSLAIGSEAKEGDTITFTVSSGPAQKEETPSSELLTIPLPTDGRTSVVLKVVQDGKTIVDNETVDCSQENYPLELQGTGTSSVDVYFDGELFNTYSVTFGGNG
jgi:serine/threonine-protein kinase